MANNYQIRDYKYVYPPGAGSRVGAAARGRATAAKPTQEGPR